MIEVLEKYIPHVTAALTQAGPDGLTVKELRGHLGAGEQFVRRALTLLLATGAVRVSHRHRPGVRGAVPRVYMLADPNALTSVATPAPRREGVTE
jgi:predicted ArsR family transcriptional regulator